MHSIFGKRSISTVVMALALLSWGITSHADSVQIGAMKDTTILSNDTNLSNGAGVSIHVGRNNSNGLKRALVYFDVAASVPAGANVTSALLRMSMDQTFFGAGSFTINLHTLTADSGEAGSLSAFMGGGQGTQAQASDATWAHNFYSTSLWSVVGGDFTAGSSAGTSVGAIGLYSWSSAQTATDVQGWLDTPAGNFGWIAIGDETVRSAKRFPSRESASGPQLFVGFDTTTIASTSTTSLSTTFTSSTSTSSTTSPFSNVAPYEEPFEEYAEGSSVDGTNGWIGAPGSTEISTNEILIAGLAEFALTRDLPLTNTTHEKVLCVVSLEGIRNKFAVSNSTVFTDFMWLPTFSPVRDAVASGHVPPVTPDDQLAVFVEFDGRLIVYSKVSSGSNVWHELEEQASTSPFVTNPTPLLKRDEWVRVSVEQNYVGSRWSVRINQYPPISDAEGWDLPVGGSRPGPWLDMANPANPGMSAFITGGLDAYYDDLQVKLTDPVQSTSSTSTTSSSTTSPLGNVIPYAEPFEDMPPYTDGFSISGTNGWIGDTEVVISTDAALITALGDYLAAGNAFPVPNAPHTKVLCIGEDDVSPGIPSVPKQIANRIFANTQTVFTDLLWLPRRGAQPVSISTNDQFAFYPHFNGALFIWHDDSGSPEWHRLTNAPIISTGEWIRVTLEQNYAHSRWRMRINASDYISDAKGWNTAAGSSQPGTWFNMVQKGGSLSRIECEGESYIDDLVVQSANPFPDALILIIR